MVEVSTWKFQKLYGGIVRVCFSPNDKCENVVPSGGNEAREFDVAEMRRNKLMFTYFNDNIA